MNKDTLLQAIDNSLSTAKRIHPKENERTSILNQLLDLRNLISKEL